MGRAIDRKLVILLVSVLLGVAMISVAAFATRSDTGPRSNTAIGGFSSPSASSNTGSGVNSPALEDLLRNMQRSRGTYGDLLSELQYLRQIMGSSSYNTSHRFGFNVSFSRATINGTLSYLEYSTMLIKSGQDLYKVLAPMKLYDGEKTLSIQELVFLGEMRKDDQLSIKAINITLISTKGDLVANIYIAAEIRDLSTGKTFTAILPLNIK